MLGFRQRLGAGALAAAVGLGVAPAGAADLRLDIGPVASDRGTLQIAIYASENTFRKTMLRGHREAARAGRAAVTLSDMAPGEYAVMVFHDLDGNGKLDTNLFGAPKEPWGSSVRGKVPARAPSWAEAKFHLPPAGTTVTVELQP